MPNLGNAWHIPDRPEPRGRSGMRDPVGPLAAGSPITIFSGNQFQGAGGASGNQLQDGSRVSYKRVTDAAWSDVPLLFDSADGNDKFFRGALATDAFAPGDVIQCYLTIAYDDHDTTFLGANVVTAQEDEARAAPSTFTLESPADVGRWGPVFALPNVGIHASVLPTGSVLMWGRRIVAGEGSLDPHECTPFLWDPKTGVVETGIANTEMANVIGERLDL